MTATLTYYLSVLSPWCYLAGNRPEEIAQRHGLEIIYKPLDVLALFARTGGIAPADRHPSRLEYRAQELTRWSRDLDLPLDLKPAHWPTNPAPASYAVIAAQEAGGGDMGQLVHSLMRAVWAEGKDIAEDAVIGACLEAAGFSSMLTLTGMVRGAEVYPANLEEAVNAGAFGAPFFITPDGARFWGQDRLTQLDAHLGAK